MLSSLPLFLGISSSSYADALTVAVPCMDDAPAQGSASGANIGLRSCKEVLSETEPLAPTPASPLIKIKKYVLSQVDAYYGNYADTLTSAPRYHPESGVDYDFLNPPGPAFGPTVCNLNENTLVLKNGSPVSERDADHFGKACGNSIEVKVQLSAPKIGDCATGKPSISPQIIYNANSGSLEEGYFRGSLVQATACYYNNVLQEIRNKKSITVGPISGVSSPCVGMAQDLNQLVKDFNVMVQDLVKDGTSPVAALQDCRTTNAKAASSASGSSSGETASVSTLHLCSSQQGIEDAFVHLATCEIFARAQQSYLVHTAKQKSHDELISKMINQLSQPCAKTCNNRFYKPSDTCHKVPSDEQVSECITSCYKARMPDVLKSTFQAFWTSDDSGVCQ